MGYYIFFQEAFTLDSTEYILAFNKSSTDSRLIMHYVRKLLMCKL